MADLLTGAAALILVTAAAALLVLWRTARAADQMLAAQLFGTAGVAALLLMAVAAGDMAVLDVALVLALLAAFAGAGFHLATGAGREGGR